jgi:hypothetical protein
MSNFQIQRSFDSLNFSSVIDVKSIKNIANQYTQMDSPHPDINATVYYRLFCTALNGKTFYSNVSSVRWTKGDQLLSIFPNPTSDGKLNIKWTGAIGSKAELSVTDALGKLILQTQLTSEHWTNSQTVELGALSKGVYFFKINIGTNKYLERVIFK